MFPQIPNPQHAGSDCNNFKPKPKGNHWAPSADDPTYYTRRGWAFGTIEDVFNCQKHGEHTMFLGANISAARPIVSKSLLEHARNSWVSLRAADAQAWAERTLLLHEEKVKTLDDLRYELGEKLLPDANGDQTFLHLVVHSDTSFGVLLHTSHVPFDGTSAKIITTRFLKTLALLLDVGSPADLNLKWGDEHANMTPAAGRVLGPNEVVEGAGYGETLNSVMMGFATVMMRGHGFKWRLGLSLSVDETAKFVEFAKSNGFTVNQVVHAALMMVCVFDNPPTADTPTDAALVSMSLVNPRYRLQSAYSGRDGYPELALCGSAILTEIAHAIKAEYLKQKAFPSLLAITQQQTEMMLPALKNAGPDAPPFMGPAYVGDGRGEDHLDRAYPGADGNAVLNLDEFLLSLNKTEPGGSFRAFSWRDQLVLSVDYNERTVDREVVQGWMDKWAELLRVVL
ncbi:hypothetical protein B0H16DRAFT_1820332 [Mycena metata]|uniref:Uncharacterized protein n=1 Tax=Mycena metata TaxID=1033252 RepID=A0AAD7MCS3_9AGAR|nr:hypothetical protein B0H16DRAFT_1820332 [Mycena metata]